MISMNFTAATFAAPAMPESKSAPSASDEAWLLDFLGPTLTTVDGREVNAAAEYWTGIVGVPFDRDVELVIPPTPLDLNLDRRVDTVFSGQWTLKGGLLANPESAGFIPTPKDPRGHVGPYSISTGFLGVREEIDRETGRGTGRYGFNCWYCHGTTDADGALLFGRPNTQINLGLILATARAMDDRHLIRRTESVAPMSEAELRQAEGLDDTFHFDANGDGAVSVAEWRRTMKLPPARITQAMMLLAGPGRLDQSVDPRMDGFIPLANLQHYWREKSGPATYQAKARMPKFTVFNPVSIPAALSGLGVAHYSWSGKDSSMKADPVGDITTRMHIPRERLADLIGFRHEGDVDFELLSRAITLDFRNVGTAGRETDSVAGNHWPEYVLTKPTEDLLTHVPQQYGADRLRRVLTRHDWPSRGRPDDPRVDAGRRIFCDSVVGRVLNQRVVYGREARVPRTSRTHAALVPLDRSKPITAMIEVRCATCHTYSPGVLPRTMPTSIAHHDFQRCDLCHFDHPVEEGRDDFVPLADHMREHELVDFDGCRQCHETHPEFGPLVFSNSWLLPFDADGDGITHEDEHDDSAAGGIGTDAYLNLDSLFTQQLLPPARRKFHETYLVSGNAMKAPSEAKYSTEGFGFVRVAPLITLDQTAPYLHNGSVPTLEALLSPVAARPTRFTVGNSQQHFSYDTGLPGNRNTGHVYGTDLSSDEKQSLIQFLKSLP